jgi:hypothetical protein
VTLDLTQAEAQQLLALLDLAIKSQGIPAAIVAMPIIQKIHNATEDAR